MSDGHGRTARLAQLRVVVIGLGALGNEVVKNLALAGIRSLILIDPDTVELRNLTRSVFFHHGSIGRPKAEVIAGVLRSEYPDIRVTAYECELADMGAGVLADADVWFSCVDSQLARLEIAALATSLRKPVVDAGAGNGDGAPGRVTWFAPEGACYGCMLPASRRREILSAWEPYAAPCGGVRGGLPGEISRFMSSVIAGLQVELGVRRLIGPCEHTMMWSIRAAPSPSIEEVRIPKADLCPFHWPVEGRVCQIADNRLTAGAVMSWFGGAEALVLQWPVCVAARCTGCGLEFAPMERVARFRRSRVCPRCSSPDLLELVSIGFIGRESPYADLQLIDLGVPERAVVRLLARSQACA